MEKIIPNESVEGGKKKREDNELWDSILQPSEIVISDFSSQVLPLEGNKN